MFPLNVVSPAGTGIPGAPTIPQNWGILAVVVGPEYAQLMVTVPAPGMPETVYWLIPRLPLVGMVTLVAVMANGVTASAGKLESPQTTA
jgi:hypothetical protein